MKKIFNQFVNKNILQSKVSKVFLGISSISLLLSLLNGKDYRLLMFELVIYITLAITVNCMTYGGCQLSSLVVLLVPLSLIIVNILEMAGIKIDIRSKIPTQNRIFDKSYLWKTEEDKQKHIDELQHTFVPDEEEVVTN